MMRRSLTCELEPTTSFLIDAATPGEVDPEELIDLVPNPTSFGSRAVTLQSIRVRSIPAKFTT